MTDTVVSSATHEVVIGFDRPFVMIGERINPTGRKLLADQMKAGDFSRVEADALAQVEAGAHMLDVNAGIPLADEPALLARAVTLVQALTDVPLSIDSSIIEALEAGLAVYQGKPLVNSVTGEDEVMERVLPLVARYGAAVVAISNDETGISMDPDVRFAVAKRIVERAADHGIPPDDVVVDPLVMPIGALGQAGQQAFSLIRRLRDELKVNTTCGASNVSFGLPNRHVVTGTFLSMAIGAGMTSAIMNPLHPEAKSAVMAADVLMGTDENCAAWIHANRDPNAPAGEERAAGATAAGAGAGSDIDVVGEHRIVFTPSGLSGTVEHGTTVLDAARRLGADLDTVCGGRGICGRCQVEPGEGTFAKWAITVAPDALGDPAPIETDYHGNRPLVAGRRLGCAARICGDVVIDIPPGSQVHRQVVRKDLDLPPITVDPSFRLWYVEVPKLELGQPGDDLTAAGAIGRALVDQHDQPAPAAPFGILAQLQPALDRQGGAITVAIDEADQLVAIWPGYVDAAFGVAVDIGSTTIAGHLCDLTSGEVLASAGRMNPQIRFGEDLMSRVSYVMMNPGGDRQLTEAVRGALDELVGELLERIEQPRDRVLELVLVGNPIMHHIVLGIDPTPLGQAPFTLATNRAVVTTARDLDLTLPNARVYVGPCIAGHVGADTAGAILAEGPHRSEQMQLLVDVGTNAEIVLGDRTRQFAASSPTGPAFEGAQISSGQRATAGAIEGVRVDPVTLESRLKVIGVECWSDDPTFAAAVAKTGVTGICGSGIIDVVAEMYLAGVIDRDGVVQGELAARSPRIVADGRTFSYVLWGDPGDPDTRIAITQNDVRAIQLAKAALRAGIDLLVAHAGDPAVADIRLAGAFGAHIDPLHALVLGLVPDCALAGVRSVGNAAGTGAVQALLSRTMRAEMEQAVREVVKIETATEPRFQELFVAAMAFPHASAPTPHLATLVTLPAPSERSDRPDAEGRGRRRRRQETNR